MEAKEMGPIESTLYWSFFNLPAQIRKEVKFEVVGEGVKTEVITNGEVMEVYFGSHLQKVPIKYGLHILSELAAKGLFGNTVELIFNGKKYAKEDITRVTDIPVDRLDHYPTRTSFAVPGDCVGGPSITVPLEQAREIACLDVLGISRAYSPSEDKWHESESSIELNASGIHLARFSRVPLNDFREITLLGRHLDDVLKA